MDEIKKQALDLIEANRISATEVADVLGKTGQIENVHALNKGLFRAGEVAFVYAINNSNYELHKQLAEKDLRDKIVFVNNINCDRAIFGDLVCKYIMLYKRAKAIVVTGDTRDTHTLIKENYPIWHSGVKPIGCVNYHVAPDISADLYENLNNMYDGGLMVCDDSGVVFVPKDKITEKFITGLRFIEFQEDIWYYCLDTLKMSTFDIVCQKKYLQPGILNKTIVDKINEYKKTLG